MKYWHEVLPKQYGIVDRFNHGYVVRNAPREFRTTLEIGAGLAEHVNYEKLTPEQEANYHAVEMRTNMVETIRKRFPRIQAVAGDCQQRLNFPDGYFDRILAIHVLEHLPNLPLAIREMYRLSNKQTGIFSVVIPCEGSIAYTLARRISAQRIFEARYKRPYKWVIEREHINLPQEIVDELHPYFTITHRSFFPIPLPWIWCNLAIGMTLRPRPEPLATPET